MSHLSPGAASAPMVRLLALIATGLILAGAGDPDTPASRGIRIDPPAGGPLAPPADPGTGSPPPAATAPPASSTQPAPPPPAASAPPPPAASAPPPIASAPPAPAAAPLAPPAMAAPQPPPPPPPTAAAPLAPPPQSPMPGNAAAPPYAAPQPAPPPPSGGEANGWTPPPEVEFTALVQAFTFVRDSAAYVAARLDAPQLYPLRAGTSVMSAARSTDGRWIIALTEDGRAAYLPAEDLGPYDPSRAPAPEQAMTVSGVAQVVDTGTLIVNGQRLALAGVEGEGSEYAHQLQELISSQGGTVICALQGRGYVCRLANGMDIARAALYNGAARVADDASEDYRLQAESARSGRRGIWR